MIGYLRIQSPMLCVLNARQDDLPPDLCVHHPFPQLRDLAEATDLQSISDTTQLSHVPFVIILTKAVQLFRSRNNNQLPQTTQHKQLFKQLVQSLRPAHCPSTAQNFEEALKPSNLRLCYAQTNVIPPNVQAVLSHPNSNPQTSNAFLVQIEQPQPHVFPEIMHYSKQQNKPSPKSMDDDERQITSSIPSDNRAATRIAQQRARFWLLAAALRQFVQEGARLPVRGSLPDMTADTESYIALQRIYSDKADNDAKRVFHFVQRIAEERAIDIDIDEAFVKSFCKNVHSIHVLSTKSIKEELIAWNLDAFKEAAMLEGGLDASTNGKASPYYAILRAVDKFHRQNGRYPGSDAVMKENDLALMHSYVSEIKEQLGLQSNSGLWRDETEEVVRYANAELHNVAAFMGGIAAQEITKIITQQFIPLDNALIVNMAEQSSTSFAV
ncbi:NEDD8-activating enzyme E1 regulatory subunit APP-BP1 [Gracilaria domingensis]|nr:NEDD8-activating enzyme E1 regulatory subunit APP-BP1 [Gracilaria domingensis]